MLEEGYVSIFSPDDALEDYGEERVLSRELISHDRDEQSMRPGHWDEYFGQEKIKANLSVYIKAAKDREEALDHVLLYGPPGLGKTTLSAIIASELGVQMRVTSGPAIERQGDLAAILSNLQPRDVLFIDEIHRLNRSIEEVLYPAMEDYALDIMIGKGPSARSVRLDLPPFTLIGATTRAGLLTSPLRDRFGMISRLELYAPEEIAQILERNAGVLKVGIAQEALDLIAGRCRGTPRIAIRLLRRLRDFAQVAESPTITAGIAERGLAAMDIDAMGLDATDRNLMDKMIALFAGGPAGLDTLAACTGEDASTIEDVYEPYLMQIGFIAKTPRGRVLTPRAFAHMGQVPPAAYEERLQGPGLAADLPEDKQERMDWLAEEKA